METRARNVLLIVVGSVLGLISAIIGLRPIENYWGQNCGSLFAPENSAPFSPISQLMEDAAFRSACPEAVGASAAWFWGLALVSIALILVGAIGNSSNNRDSPIPRNRTIDVELENLNKLYKEGVLSDSEFAAAKKKLLGDL